MCTNKAILEELSSDETECCQKVPQIVCNRFAGSNGGKDTMPGIHQSEGAVSYLWL